MGPDFRRLWTAFAVSEFGSAVGYGTLPLVAVLVLRVPDFQVSLLAALAGISAAVVGLPLGPWIEFRPKRPVMIAADLARFAALVSVPVAAAAGLLTYAQLCLVAMVQTTGALVFTAASGAHLKALVPAAQRGEANARFEGTLWTANSAGPPLGGALTSWLGVPVTITLDAVSFLLSALGVRRIRAPEPAPPTRTGEAGRGARITAGWRYILGHRELRALWLNALLFGGGIMAAVPLLSVRMLRDLGFPPWQYGLALGLPCIAGVLGSLAMKPLVRAYGQRRVLLGSGVFRALWLGLWPLAPAGVGGLVLVIAAESLALLGSGVFNPTFGTFRMAATEDAYLARVLAAWSISSRTGQPLCIAAGGLLAALTSVRTALLVVAAAVLASVVLLPWRVPVSAGRTAR